MISITRLFILSIMLFSCAFNDIENYQIAKTIIFGGIKVDVDKNFFESQRFSFAVASIGRNSEAVLSLKAIDKDNIYEWISEDGAMIYTKDGFIVKTFGLRNDFVLYNPNIVNKNSSFESYFSFYKPDLANAIISYSLVGIKPSSFESLGALNSSFTHNFEKKVEILDWNSKVTIIYNTKGMPVYASQKINPFLGEIYLRFYYK